MARCIRAGGEGGVAGLSGLAQLVLLRPPRVGTGGSWLYKHDATLRLPYQDHLSALIHEPTFGSAVGEAVFDKARVIKDLGNLAVHSHKPVRQLDALTATKELFHVCTGWRAPMRAERSRRTIFRSTRTASQERRRPAADARTTAEAGEPASRAGREALRTAVRQEGAR